MTIERTVAFVDLAGFTAPTNHAPSAFHGPGRRTRRRLLRLHWQLAAPGRQLRQALITAPIVAVAMATDLDDVALEHDQRRNVLDLVELWAVDPVAEVAVGAMQVSADAHCGVSCIAGSSLLATLSSADESS